MNLRKLIDISIINTFRLNLHYFGWGGVIHPIILASRNVKINKLSGKVTADGLEIGAVQIGFGYVGIIDNKHTRAVWENSGHITFRGITKFGPGTRICCNGELEFRGEATISAASDIICWKKIEIGHGFLMSWDCLIMDTDFHKIIENETGKRVNDDSKISIGDNVWIGCRSTVLKHAVIPNDCVIGAGSIVSSKLREPNSVYRHDSVLKNGIHWCS